MDWEKLFRRYVWDDVRTPYFTRVNKLDRRQADYEVYVYALFVGVFFAAVALTATTDHLASGPSTLTAFYAFSAVCAAIIFGFTKHFWAGVYCAATPVAVALYLFMYGFPEGSRTSDHVLITAAIILVTAYSWRIIDIGRTYSFMPDPTTPETGRRRNPWT